MSERDAQQPAVGSVDNDLDKGIWYRAACSGLWYRNPRAAADVSAVRIDGELFVEVGAAASDVEKASLANRTAFAPAHGSEASDLETVLRALAGLGVEQWHMFVRPERDHVCIEFGAMKPGGGGWLHSIEVRGDRTKTQPLNDV